MSKTVKVRKGLNIRLKGEAEKVKVQSENTDVFAVKPTDFHNLTPKLVVKEGEKVKAGSVLFYDKYNDQIKFTAPVSGTLKAIIRGEKRKILEVQIEADKEIQYESFQTANPDDLNKDEVKAKLLDGGMWPFIKERPVDIVANPAITPKAIFISGFDSAPLAPDYDFIMHGQDEALQVGVNAIRKLTEGKVHLNLRSNGSADKAFENVKGVVKNYFNGPHPAGNPGVQIHHIDPINKGEYVWVVNPQDVATIGKYFMTGKADFSKVVAVTGSEVKNPKYFKVVGGCSIKNIIKDNIIEGEKRFISGNALTGTKIENDGFLGFYDSQVTVLPEGNQAKFFITDGWAGPGFDKFSNSRLFPTFLLGNKRFRLDTNTNGEERAFVVTGELEKVFPFDIYPMQLAKSIMMNDIDMMEKLGIYEVAPEDFALCEYVCTSKINLQDVVRKGLDVIKEECL